MRICSAHLPSQTGWRDSKNRQPLSSPATPLQTLQTVIANTDRPIGFVRPFER